jgi:hypothetical protein
MADSSSHSSSTSSSAPRGASRLEALRAKKAEADKKAQGDVSPMMTSRIEKSDIVAALAIRQGVPTELLKHFSTAFGVNVANGVLALQNLINNVQSMSDFHPNMVRVETLRKLDTGLLKTMLRQENHNYKSVDPFSIASQAFGNALVKWFGLSDDGTTMLAKFLGLEYRFPTDDFLKFYSEVSKLIKSSETYLTKVEYNCLEYDDDLRAITVTILFYFAIVPQDDGSLVFVERPAVEIPPAVDEDTFLYIENMRDVVTLWWTDVAPKIFNVELVDKGADYSFVYAHLVSLKRRDQIPPEIIELYHDAADFCANNVYTDVPDAVLDVFLDRAAMGTKIDTDFVKLKATQDSASKWLQTGNPKNKDNTLGILTPGHLPMTTRIDKVFGKNLVFLHAAMASTVSFGRVVVHGAQSKTLVRCIPLLATYAMAYTQRLHAWKAASAVQVTTTLPVPTMFHNNAGAMVPILVKGSKNQDLPIGATLVHTLDDAMPNFINEATNVFYVITDIGDWAVGAPAGEKDTSGTGAYAFRALMNWAREKRFSGVLIFPWHIPNQLAFAEAIDAMYDVTLAKTFTNPDGSTGVHNGLAIHSSYLAHPHLASDLFWFVLYIGSKAIDTRGVSDVLPLSVSDLHVARIRHMARTTQNLSTHQFVLNTGVNPRIPYSGRYNAAAYSAAVAVNNQGKSETRKQQRAAMADAENSATTKMFREAVLSRQRATGDFPHHDDNNNAAPPPSNPFNRPSPPPTSPPAGPPPGLSASPVEGSSPAPPPSKRNKHRGAEESIDFEFLDAD